MSVDFKLDADGIALMTLNRPEKPDARDEDVQEGRAAFAEKRAPRFRGRARPLPHRQRPVAESGFRNFAYLHC